MMAGRPRAGACLKLGALAVFALAFALLFLPQAEPVSANPLQDIASVEAGAGHACAVTTTGAVKCWGLNIGGALGDGTTTTSLRCVAS